MAASIRKKPAGAALPEPTSRRAFRRKLLDWYDRNGRTLPWRETSDPYHILVSEIMLQQTQVDRVLPKYQEWLGRYPTFEALADATEADVTSTWYPLGYNIRPKRLQAIAREAVAKYGGKLPSDEATLLSFKGIGAYTAGAIRSFAFRERAAILDTNVARVLFRVYVGRGATHAHATKKHLWRIAAALVPMRRAFDFNQALMDFGAMLCTARKPKCLICPMASLCSAYPHNPEHETKHEDSRRINTDEEWMNGLSSSPRLSRRTGGFSSRSGSREPTSQGTGNSPEGKSAKASRRKPRSNGKFQRN